MLTLTLLLYSKSSRDVKRVLQYTAVKMNNLAWTEMLFGFIPLDYPNCVTELCSTTVSIECSIT